MPNRNLFTSAGRKVADLRKSINYLIRISLRRLRSHDAEQWIAEFERLSGSGHSDGWSFDRSQTTPLIHLRSGQFLC
jgi:hypothetical protein